MSMTFALLLAMIPIRPDVVLTPGTVNPVLTEAALCAPSFSTGAVRNVSAATKAAVFAKYGIVPRSGRFEIDHLVSLELGGTNDAANLWPQSYETQPFNATVKDGLENRLHHLVCTRGADKIPLAEAQQAIRDDWTVAYKRYLCVPSVRLTAIETKACEALK